MLGVWKPKFGKMNSLFKWGGLNFTASIQMNFLSWKGTPLAQPISYVNFSLPFFEKKEKNKKN